MALKFSVEAHPGLYMRPHQLVRGWDGLRRLTQPETVQARDNYLFSHMKNGLVDRRRLRGFVKGAGQTGRLNEPHVQNLLTRPEAVTTLIPEARYTQYLAAQPGIWQGPAISIVLGGLGSVAVDLRMQTDFAKAAIAESMDITPVFRSGMAEALFPLSYLGYRFRRYLPLQWEPTQADLRQLCQELSELRANFPQLFDI